LFTWGIVLKLRTTALKNAKEKRGIPQ
jgi:hypothetical protein